MQSRKQLDQTLQSLAECRAVVTTDAPYLFNSTDATSHFCEVYALHAGESPSQPTLQVIVHNVLLRLPSIKINLSKVNPADITQSDILGQIELDITYRQSFDDLDQRINLAMARLAEQLPLLADPKPARISRACQSQALLPVPPDAIVTRLKQANSLNAFFDWYDRWACVAFREFERKLKQSA